MKKFICFLVALSLFAPTFLLAKNITFTGKVKVKLSPGLKLSLGAKAIGAQDSNLYAEIDITTDTNTPVVSAYRLELPKGVLTSNQVKGYSITKDIPNGAKKFNLSIKICGTIGYQGTERCVSINKQKKLGWFGLANNINFGTSEVEL